MLPRVFWLAALLAVGAHAQSSDTTSSDSSSESSTGSRSGSSSGSSSRSGSGSSSASIITLTGSQVSATTPTGSYKSLGSQVTASNLYATRSSTSSSSSTSSGSRTGTGSDTTTSSSSTSRGTTSTATILQGGGIVTELVINGTFTSSSHINSTATTSSGTGSRTTSATPTNTQPCNNYPEFCDRKYGNITEVVAHNAAFVKKGNAASNQNLDITTQLNDGIRMIQGEVHWNESGLYNCHTSCDILYAGTYLSTLKEIASWVKEHPYDVVTILMVNSQYADVGNFSAVYEESGILDYVYEPPYIPMKLDQWPTLSSLILSQKRVIVFMDYQADQSQVPYILDEFTHMWETPFSPTDRDFPCTTQRPPDLNQTVAKDELMYLANHNLNTDVSIFGTSLLIPTSSELNITNAAGDETGMLGTMSENCTAMWDRPPNWLLVDFYDIGDGSVFEVAAKANNVTYTRSCCGSDSSSGATEVKSSATALVVAFVATFLFFM